MADDKHRSEDTEVEGHLDKAAGVEGRNALEPEDKFKASRASSRDEEPEVEGHILKAAQPEKKYKKA
jgi:hypothetical protein